MKTKERRELLLNILNKSANYIAPKEYLKLNDVEKELFFTLAIGDKIVKNAIDFEVTKIANLSKNFDNVVTIMAVRENKLFNALEVDCK